MGAKVNYYQNDVIVDSRPRSQRALTIKNAFIQ